MTNPSRHPSRDRVRSPRSENAPTIAAAGRNLYARKVMTGNTSTASCTTTKVSPQIAQIATRDSSGTGTRRRSTAARYRLRPLGTERVCATLGARALSGLSDPQLLDEIRGGISLEKVEHGLLEGALERRLVVLFASE